MCPETLGESNADVIVQSDDAAEKLEQGFKTFGFGKGIFTVFCEVLDR
jgi:hypothetical protein